MWQSGGGVSVGSVSTTTMVEGRQTKGSDSEGGALNNPSTDTSKSMFDSNTDSGFLSGSNLVSSSSIDDSPNMPMRAPSDVTPNMTRSTSRDAPRSSTILGTSELLDSGIDITEQLSTLQLSGSVTSNDRENREVVEQRAIAAAPDEHTQSDNNKLGISSNHVTLLREIFSPDDDGDTQLHVAVMRGFVEVVYRITRLLPHQAFLDLTNNTGRTALHLAVASGVPSVVRHLVVCGASPVARDLSGNTPLHSACAQANPAMVSHLTRPVTVAEVLNTQLSYAPTHTPGLLAADLTNYRGETCVHVAAGAGLGAREILQHLTCYGADVNAKECLGGRTALHMAVEARDPGLINHLVTVCRAVLTVETYAMLSPYQLALANGCPGIATQLLDLGAPAQLLPAHLLCDDEADDSDEYQVDDSVPVLNGWAEVDDIRLAGVPVAAVALTPVTTAAHTINADLYY